MSLPDTVYVDVQRDSNVTLLPGYLLDKRDKNVKDVPNKLTRIM